MRGSGAPAAARSCGSVIDEARERAVRRRCGSAPGGPGRRRRGRSGGLAARGHGRFSAPDEIGTDLLGPFLVDRADRLLEGLRFVFGEPGDLHAEPLDLPDERLVVLREALACERDLLLAGLERGGT